MPSIKDFTVRAKWNASGEPVYKLPDYMKQQQNALPSIQPPTQTAAPIQAPAIQQPQGPIELPAAYQQQYNLGPSTTPPPSRLQMPDFSPRVNPSSNLSQNWADFLSVAHNAYTR